MIDFEERKRIRNLAQKWMDLANLPLMNERRRQWAALKDLKGERPMILVETEAIAEYVSEKELICKDPLLRWVEKRLLWITRHTEEIGDDIVLEPNFRLNWDIELSDYGVAVDCTRAVDAQGYSFGYAYKNPINNSEDIKKLVPRTMKVDRDKTLAKKDKIEDVIGDILPVVIHGSEQLNAALTSHLFKLIGMENMMLWIYDEPEALHKIMAFLRDDRLALYKWMECEKLFGLNNTNQFIGSGSIGYTSDLPADGFNGIVRMKDLWLWLESQETISISPQDFAEFFLPYMADIQNNFGLVYYGCCEPVHDRWEYIKAAIPKIRAVSISPWCDKFIMGEKLGRNDVFSRKPHPSYISGKNADWSALRSDVEETLKAAKGCNLEFIFRDIITINGDRGRLAKWVAMTRALIG